MTSTISLLAAGGSWRWQLRDSKGQWVEMGSEVKWLSQGVMRSGRVTGSPSPGVATVQDDDGNEHNLSANRLTAVTPDASTSGPKAAGRRRLRGLVQRKTRKAQIEFKQTPAMEEAMHDMADIITTDVAPENQDDAFEATSDVIVGKIAERLPKAQQALATVKALKERGTDAQIRLAVYIQTRSRLDKLVGKATFWAQEFLGDMGGTDNPTPSWGAIPTLIGLPNPYSHPAEFLVESSKMISQLLKALRPLVSAGDSWRWQLRDKKGQWVRLGTDVRWLDKGKYRHGMVIGSPSPGVAKVRDLSTFKQSDISSARLEVVGTADEDRSSGSEQANTGSEMDQALVDLARQAKETGVPLDWGADLIPDQFASLREDLLTTVPALWKARKDDRRRFGPEKVRKGVALDVWKKIRDVAVPLGFNDETGPIYAQSIVIKILERGEREKDWASEADDVKTKLAPNLNKVRKIGKVGVAVTQTGAIDILENDRFKTQFETGESGGLYDPSLRAGYEMALFGLHPDVEVQKRPIYGYVFTPGQEGASGVSQYGDTRFVLKPGVRGRTSITVGDSLGTGAVPVPLDGPDVGAKEAYMATSAIGDATWRLTGDMRALEILQEDEYFEAQIRGGLTVDDIEEIVIARGGSRRLSEPAKADCIEQLAKERGIPVRRL